MEHHPSNSPKKPPDAVCGTNGIRQGVHSKGAGPEGPAPELPTSVWRIPATKSFCFGDVIFHTASFESGMRRSTSWRMRSKRTHGVFWFYAIAAVFAFHHSNAQIGPDGTGTINGYQIGPGANLEQVEFSGVNLNGADLRDANLAHTVFGYLTTTDGMNLGGAQLFGAVFEGDLSSVQLIGAKTNFAHVVGLQHGSNDRLPSGYKYFAPNDPYTMPFGIVGPAVDWSRSFLESVAIGSFGETTSDLRGMSFKESYLTDVDFGGGEIEGCSFHGARLERTRFTFAKFGNGVYYDELTQFLGSYTLRLPDGNGGWVYYYIDPTTDERWILDNDRDFIGVNEDFDDRNSELGVVGESTNLSEKDFRGYSLAGLSLRWANLTKANLTSVDLSFADLRHCIFNAARLTGAAIEGADFSNTRLEGVRSGGLFGIPSALPDNWRIIAGHLVGPGANLRDADLSGAKLVGSDLTGANLAGANLSGCDLSGATLTGAMFSEASLDRADLSGANLSKANLSSATGLDTTQFDGALLDQIRLPTGYRVVDGFVVGGGRPEPLSAFRVWARENNIPDTVLEDQNAPTGYPFFLHYGLDVSPSSAIPASHRPRVERNTVTGKVVFRYAAPRNDRGVIFTPETATNPAGPWQDGTISATTIGEDENNTFHQVESLPDSARFFRIRIDYSNSLSP